VGIGISHVRRQTDVKLPPLKVKRSHTHYKPTYGTRDTNHHLHPINHQSNSSRPFAQRTSKIF
jgi:hypothetical protein